MKTERDFQQAVRQVAERNDLTQSQQNFVEMHCAENGYDCGDDCWTVAIATLAEIIDQGTLIAVANNEGL